MTYHKYDVDDYYAIDPAFGTMEDYEALLKECHERGIRVYMDLVLNHTSEDNAWFAAASDYLHELPSGAEPNVSDCKYFDYYNFSRESSSGYAPLEGTDWYYEARFWSEMPDLNLSSEAVRGEIRDILAFWLGKGVDGFRLDAVTYYIYADPEANVEFLRFLTEAGRSIRPDCYFVGEAWTDRNTIAQLYASGIDSLFDFPFSGNEGFIANIINGTYKASDYVKGMLLAQEAYSSANPDYVDAPFYTNHDMGRSAGYYAADDGPVTKMAYAMSLFMTGNSFVYYGEEIGMKGAGKDENKRAPMYWSSDPEAQGMCSGPIDMEEVTMIYPSYEESKDDPLSIYNYVKQALKIRNSFPSISHGNVEVAYDLCHDRICAYTKEYENEKVLIVWNLGGAKADTDLSSMAEFNTLKAVLNTNEEKITLDGNTLSMPAWSVAVIGME
jgi:glycosidase